MGLNCFTTKPKITSETSNLKGCKKKAKKKDKLKKESVIQSNTNGHYSSTNKRFTAGPVDGSLYARVNKPNSELDSSLNKPINSESIYTNLNATSIDSGISSSLGEHQSTGNKSIYSTIKYSPEIRTNTRLNQLNEIEPSFKSAKTSSIEESDYLDRLDIELIKLVEKLDSQKKNSMPKTKEESELDDLLSDMLLELQSTDINQTQSNKENSQTNLNNVSNKTSEQMLDSNQNRQLCGRASANLASIADDEQPTSPRFLIKPNYDGGSDSNQTAAGQQPFSYGIQTESPALQRRRLQLEKTAYVSESDPDQQNNQSIDRRSEENLIEILRQDADYDRSKDRHISTTSSVVSDGSVIAGSEDISWLERQKLKLKNRKEGDLWKDRFNKERSLMAELRTAVQPKQQLSLNEPLHIDTNQSVNIPIERSTNNSSINRYQRSQSANYDRYEVPNFRTVHTKKKTLQRGANGEQTADTPTIRSSTPVRSQSPAPSINSLNKTVHATNLPIKEEFIKPVQQQQSVYGTITRTPVVTSVPIHSEIQIARASASSPNKRTVDETDLNELIHTASSPVYAHSRPSSAARSVSRQSQTTNEQSAYKTHQNYANYNNQSTPIRCIADLPDMDNPVLPNPRWSPISGSYLKKNYPNERAATPLFPISTPTRNNEQFTFDNNGIHSSCEVNNNSIKHDYNSSRTSSPAMSAVSNDKFIYPETYLKVKREQAEKERFKQLTESPPLKLNSSNQLNSTKINQFNHSNQSNHQSTNQIIHQPTKFNQSFESTNLDEDQSTYLNQSQRSSFVSLDDGEIINTNPKFIHDCIQYWYRPSISRDEAIKILLNKPTGSFIVRDSDSFKGAFGLAIRVSQTIADLQRKSYGKGETALVRHFLIEPTSRGVRIKGCLNEPVFSSLSALVYQHTTTPLALPCKLVLPEIEPIQTLSIKEPKLANQLQQDYLLQNGAACNVLYLISIDTESLTGPEAIKRACEQFLRQFNKKLGISDKKESNDLKRTGSKKRKNKLTDKNDRTIDLDTNEPSKENTPKIDADINGIVVYFKVSSKGISITDNSHRHFFRKHYTIQSISHCGLDPEDRKFQPYASSSQCRLFGFVSRVGNSVTNNQTHLFADLEQPASVIVSFIQKVMSNVLKKY